MNPSFVIEVPRTAPVRARRGAHALVRRLPTDPVASSFDQHPVVSSVILQTAVGAAIGGVCGAGLGLLVPAKAGLLTLTGASAMGARFAAKGLSDGAELNQFLNPDKIVHTTMGSEAHNMLTASTGSTLLDAGLGAGIGYLLYPSLGFAMAGAFLAAVGGVAGIALLVGYRIAVR